MSAPKTSGPAGGARGEARARERDTGTPQSTGAPLDLDAIRNRLNDAGENIRWAMRRSDIEALIAEVERLRARVIAVGQYSVEGPETRLERQAIEISRLLSDAGIGAMPLPEGVRTVIAQRDQYRLRTTTARGARDFQAVRAHASEVELDRLKVVLKEIAETIGHHYDGCRCGACIARRAITPPPPSEFPPNRVIREGDLPKRRT